MSASSSATRTRRGFSASVMAAILAVAGPLSDRGGILYRERPPRPRIPTGRGTGLKTQTVWVRIPPRALKFAHVRAPSPGLWARGGHGMDTLVVQRLGHLVQVGVEQVGVHPQSDRRVGMPEHARQRQHVHP